MTDSTTTDIKLRVIPFSGKAQDWATWKFKNEALMAKLGLLKYMTEDKQGNAEAKKLWEEKQPEVYYHLVASCDGEAISVLRGAEKGQGREAWKLLEARYNPKTETRKATLQNELFSMSNMREDETIDTYIDRIEDLKRQLEDTGVEVNDELIKGVIKRGLPVHYEPMIAVLQMQENLTLQEMSNQLRVFGQEQQVRRSHQREISMQTQTRDKPQFKPRVTCYHCGKPGHIKKECRKLKAELRHQHKANMFEEAFVMREERRKAFDTVPNEGIFQTTKRRRVHPHHVTPRDTYPKARADGHHRLESGVRTWLVDSGATTHISPNQSDFYEYQEISDHPGVSTSQSGSKITVKGQGRIKITTQEVRTRQPLTITIPALHVPEASCRIISVPQLTNKGCKFTFQRDSVITTPKGHQIKMKYSDRKYVIDDSTSSSDQALVSLELWHQRLGHASEKPLMSVIKTDQVGEVTDQKYDIFCGTCAKAKTTKTSIPKTREEGHRATYKGQTMFIDVAGPFKTTASNGDKYALQLKDDYSGWTILRTLPNKTGDTVLQAFKEMVEQLNGESVQIVRLHSDGGSEFRINRDFTDYCKSRNIRQTFTSRNTPQQNGRAERAWRTLLNTARAMLIQSKRPRSYWNYAMKTACYIWNRLPTTYNDGISPYQKWCGHKPDLKHLKVWGCPAFVYVEQRGFADKLGDRAKEGIFVGYDESSKSYLIRLPDGQVHTSRDVVFDETFRNKPLGVVSDVPVPIPVLVGPVRPLIDKPGQPPEATRQDEGHQPMEDTTATSGPATRTRSRTEAACITTEPQTYEEAIQSPEKEKWIQAMKEEVDSLLSLQTWTMVPRPKDRKVIKSKWTFKLKYDPDGRISRYKARLVAKGYTQQQGIDYSETFAPVVNPVALRLLLALATLNDWELEQSDIVTAYLNADLKEELYLEPPQGMKPTEDKVCLLKKSIYGLKQAGREWNQVIHKWLIEFGFQKTQEPCMYIKKQGDDILVLVLYVDDMIYGGNSPALIKEFKKALATEFKVKHEGDLKWILGMEVKRDREAKTLTLSQEQYIKKTLEKFNMIDCHPVPTPCTIARLRKEESTEEHEKKMENIPYKEAVGSLLYAATHTRPDISFSVNCLSRYMDNPSPDHWSAVKRVFRYLKGTMSKSLTYRATEDRDITVYTDSDWATDPDTRRSTTGYLVMLAGATISWNSKLQPTVAHSSSEAEYMAAASATKEILYIDRIIQDIQEPTRPIKMFEDNTGCIALAKNPVNPGRTKHIDLRYHIVREQVNAGVIQVVHCPSSQMIADALTKGLTRDIFQHHVQAMMGHTLGVKGSDVLSEGGC